jgi:hypothetical protein
MNITLMLKDLKRLRRQCERQANNANTVGPNYAGQFILQGVEEALEIVKRHVYSHPSTRSNGKQYASSSDQLKGGRHA